MKEIGMYIHIPFCVQKCSYCDFHSYSNRNHQMKEYMDALIKEMTNWEEVFKNYRIKAIFIGGGTPSIISIEEMDKMINTIHSKFRLANNMEFSIESNPGTLEKEKLEFYLKSNINRLSMGLQAWQNPLLKVLGRIHSREEFVRNFHMARETGFENINVDLMFGLPKQTIKEWEETLTNIISLNPEHISTYSLKIEENTPFGKLYEKGKLTLPSEEVDRNMYHYTIDKLTDCGYKHYEISNFAKNGKESVHNKIYWNNDEYIGFGLGSHSYMDKTRFSNATDLEEYIHMVNNNESPRIFEEKNGINDEIAETMFLGLRMMEGIHIKKFEDRFKRTPYDVYPNEIKKLVNEGLLEGDGERLRLTRKGIDLSNQVFMEFLLE